MVTMVITTKVPPTRGRISAERQFVILSLIAAYIRFQALDTGGQGFLFDAEGLHLGLQIDDHRLGQLVQQAMRFFGGGDQQALAAVLGEEKA